MFMPGMSGVSLGLLISSLLADPKTAGNIVPLVLIPQIMMGGALIKYEDMNRNLALLYALSHWFSEHPSADKSKKMESKLQVDRKSTRLNSSHRTISYAVFCLKKKKTKSRQQPDTTTAH